MTQNLYLKSGELFATGFTRVVHGERGDYIELTSDHIQMKLVPRFNNSLSDRELLDLGYYYKWLYPEAHSTLIKVYYQLRTVKYADYKVGYYYISPSLLKDFKDPEKLF